jgi:hypothetical protein
MKRLSKVDSNCLNSKLDCLNNFLQDEGLVGILGLLC